MRTLLIVWFGFISAICPGQPSQLLNRQIDEIKTTIYLPPDFNSGEPHKILYVNDGQTAFGLIGLNLDGKTNELLEKKLIEPLIIVAIHSDKNRTSQYVPYFDSLVALDFGNYSPRADRYTKRIIQKVMPVIEKEYAPSKSNGITGYSFGGLYATWAALHYPDHFTFSGAQSPSYWVKDFRIMNEAKKSKPEQTYYFDVGTGEWNYYVPFLQKSNLTILENVFYYEDFGGYHDLESWRNRTHNILLLFAGSTNRSQYTWVIQKEVIKSQSNNRFYLRINPVIIFHNGLTCSLSFAATFQLTNPGDGIVNADGSFRFTQPRDLKVIVTYQGESREVLLSYSEIEKIKSSL